MVAAPVHADALHGVPVGVGARIVQFVVASGVRSPSRGRRIAAALRATCSRPGRSGSSDGPRLKSPAAHRGPSGGPARWSTRVCQASCQARCSIVVRRGGR